jgi:predicted transcriptional regulator
LDNLLSGLISSKTRIKLLIRLFLNPQTKSYLRELSKEFNLSTNSIREELNQLVATNLLVSEKHGRQVYYYANTSHSLFPEIRSMVSKVTWVDQIVAGIAEQLVGLEQAFLVGDYAVGKDSRIIDVVLVGDIDENALSAFSKQTSHKIGRKIRSLILSQTEFESWQTEFDKHERLLIWDSRKFMPEG